MELTPKTSGENLAHWPYCQLSQLTAFITKGSTPTTYGFHWESDGVLFLRSECVSDTGLDLSQSMFISEKAHAILKRSEIIGGDILITITGNVGRVVLLDQNFGRGNINQHIARIRVTATNVDKHFVYHFLSQPSVRTFFNQIVTGQAYPQISLKQVRDLQIPIPPTKSEQTAIATALSDADALIASLEKLIAKKRLIKQGVMQKLLEPKEGWEVKTLAQIGEFSKGQGITKVDANSGSIPCVRYGELYTKHNDHIKHFYSFISPEVAKTAKKLKKGDILFAGSGETKEEIGKCAAFLGDELCYAGGDIVILSPHLSDSVFLGYSLNSKAVSKQKSSRGQGDAVVHISASQLSEIAIKIPSLAEQQKIGRVLLDIDNDLQKWSDKLEKCIRIKRGMMQTLLTGKIRLV